MVLLPACLSSHFESCFFFNDTATTEIYTLSLHDALPISPSPAGSWRIVRLSGFSTKAGSPPPTMRSEEHTSELQSHSDLVCRLLLEKKKKTKTADSRPGRTDRDDRDKNAGKTHRRLDRTS